MDLDDQQDKSKLIRFLTEMKLLVNPKCRICQNELKIGNYKSYSYLKTLEVLLQILLSSKNQTFCRKPYFSSLWQHRYISCLTGFSLSNTLLNFIHIIQNTIDISHKAYLKIKKVLYTCLRSFYIENYENFDKFGSRGETVVIDEICFRRKYNQGRVPRIYNQQIFGLTERGGRFSKSVLIPVYKQKGRSSTSSN
ncbi:hypothetical protein ABPG72_013479 [Tetrahymena utriculariae]